MDTHYDGIILGSGHNSLVLQAYLSRLGLQTLCIEQAAHLGGGLATEPSPDNPGFVHNPHSFFHRALTRMPWYGDLHLQRLGARYVEPDLNVALLRRDGRVLEWWTDFDRTAASFARFSPGDAAALRRWRDAFAPVVDKILLPEAQHPPRPPAQRRAALLQSPEGRLLLETSRLSPRQFVQREFSHPTVQAGLLFFNGLREVDLRVEGFGHHIPALLASRGKAQMCLGGSAQLAGALVAAVEEAGGQLRPGVRPRRLLVEGQRVVGVETEGGEQLGARLFVASGLNPQQTFLELLAEDVLPRAWRRKAQQYQYNLLAPLFGLYLDLTEPPQYRSAEGEADLGEAFMVILGLEAAAHFERIVDHHERGTIPPTAMWGTCPTLFDPGQAPPGRHTAFMWEKLPYSLWGQPGRWDRAARAHGRRLLQTWSQYAPNLAGAVIDWHVRSPLDVERALPNMRGGDLLVGSFDHGQVGYHRPFAGAGHYRTHLEGLYLCGSCCHPGGNITGLPGYNCAQVLTADLGLDTPWFGTVS
ncbi:MAG: NAD(P)-binding protein [Candidatus Latescibacteria bacterium]|nr:NAD(P)-binding protein [Candidatus Latescibacterota bacterium]